MFLMLWLVVGGFGLHDAEAGIWPPEISGVTLNWLPSQTYSLSSVPALYLNATVDDTFTGGNTTAGANYTVGLYNWPGTPMNATDGFFDGSYENVTAMIPNPGKAGSWSYCVYGWDAVPNYNTTSTACADLTIIDDMSPVITSVALDGSQNLNITLGTSSVVATALISDAGQGDSNILSASYNASWSPFPAPMYATDGAFDGVTEAVNATIPTGALALGDYTVCVDGIDNATNGADSKCANLTVVPFVDTQPPEVSAVSVVPDTVYVSSPPSMVMLLATVDDTSTGSSTIASATYTMEGGPSVAMSASDGTFDEVLEPVTANVDTPTAVGQYSVCAYGSDSEGNDNTTGLCTVLTVADDVDPVADFTVTPEELTVDVEVTLDAGDSSDAHSAIDSYSWTVIDPDLNERTLSGEITVFTPHQAGEYTIILNVSDDWGNWDTEQYTLEVEGLEADMLALQVAAGVGVSIAIIVLAAGLLLYRIPPIEKILAREDKVKPFDLRRFEKLPVLFEGAVAIENARNTLDKTRESLIENARSSEMYIEWKSQGEVTEDV